MGGAIIHKEGAPWTPPLNPTKPRRGTPKALIDHIVCETASGTTPGIPRQRPKVVRGHEFIGFEGPRVIGGEDGPITVKKETREEGPICQGASQGW